MMEHVNIYLYAKFEIQICARRYEKEKSQFFVQLQTLHEDRCLHALLIYIFWMNFRYIGLSSTIAHKAMSALDMYDFARYFRTV